MKSKFLYFLCFFLNLVCYCHKSESSIRYDTLPAWSPDGQYIAFCRMVKKVALDTLNPYENNNSIFSDAGIKLLELNTGKEKVLVHTFSELDWTKDSRWVVYEGIYKVDVKTERIRRILIDTLSSYPVISSDGSRILYCSILSDSNRLPTSGIYLTDTNGSYRKFLVEGVFPDWHPAGDRFLFYRKPNLYIADTNGNIIKTILEDKSIQGPRFSPDGSKIIYCDEYIVGESDRYSFIYLIDTLGQEQKILTQGIEPRWSPDGKEIVYSGYDEINDGMVLWIMEIDGKNKRKITDPD
ncbi:MAG: hypothetical protein N3A65_02875 [candidate division WOR-3 bacterium]|nr:hypothetical protein [candidate division WOR-3 bacterium]